MLVTTGSEHLAEDQRAAPITDPPEKYVPDLVYSATRLLLRARGPDEAVSLLSQLVHDLGGSTVPASANDPNALPIDISLGQGEPVYAVASPRSAARWLLSTYLPDVIEDARVALELASRAEVLAKDAGIDPVSGLPSHGTLSRLVARLKPGDAIVAVDVDWDRFPGSGTAHGDQEIVRAFARDLRKAARATEFCCRSGGGEFVALLNEPGSEGAFKLLGRLQDRWVKRPQAIPHTFSGGIATIDDRGWRPAIQAADRALRRSQKTGDCWEAAQPEDYES
jgi:diguanylate cyclase (GGDEF)-like protein